MKRILLLLSVLLLLFSSAQADSSPYALLSNALYRIVLRTEVGDVTLGSGVLFGANRLILTAPGCCVEGDLYVIGNDGEHAVKSAVQGESVALLELATPSSGEPLSLAEYDVQALPYLFGSDEAGNTGALPLYLVRQGRYNGQDALILTGEEGLLPGAFMADEKGRLVSLVVAQQMEGVGTYTALEADELRRAILEEKEADDFLDISLRWQDGLVSIAWEDEKRDTGCYIVTVSGDENEYYTTWEVEPGERSIDVALTPGHTWYVQVQWAESANKALPPDWNAMKPYTLPETAFTRFCYTQECYLASASRAKKVTGKLAEMPLISVDTLTDEKAAIYLQISSAYDVSAEEEAVMTVELIAPDGQFFFEEMMFSFSPDEEAEDSFAVPVDDLLAACAEFSGGTLKAGNYLLRCAIAGQIAGEYAFVVQPAGTAAPEVTQAPATSGFVSGVTATQENGLITLAWDATAIPQGAKVHANYYYEGNTFSTYHDMKEGAASTQLFAVPGRRGLAWVAWSTEGAPAHDMPQKEGDFVIIEAVEETPLIAHSFRNVGIGLVPSDDPEAAAKGAFLPQIPLTREILADRDTPLYFQTEDAYRVSATSEQHPLAIILMTPEGLVFVEPGSYTFDLTLQSSDLWLKDISGLFESYESLVRTQAWPAGEYRILYCIDGKVAGEFTFTLE